MCCAASASSVHTFGTMCSAKLRHTNRSRLLLLHIRYLLQVDVQSGIPALGGSIGGGPAIAAAYVEAMEDSVSEAFGAENCINCMCHSTENLYSYRCTAVARAADDFYPDRPESHSVHIINVAFNSLFLGEVMGGEQLCHPSRTPKTMRAAG